MISFNFSKKKETVKLQDSKLRDASTLEENEDKDFVISVQANEILGTKKKEEKKKELVIPLISRNEWRVGKGISLLQPSKELNGTAVGESNGIEDDTKDQEKDLKARMDKETSNLNQNDNVHDLETQAIKEILNETQNLPSNGQVPLLLLNSIPNGYEEDDNMDVSLRPEQSTMDDYEQIPIEEFGMAMLRGMGWKKSEGIGLTNKQNIVMLEPQLRPKGLGLGAERPQANKDVGPSASQNNEKEEELRFKIGAGAVINKGSDKGMYGRVEAFDEDNNRVILKLAINKKMAAVSKFHITLVSEKDFDKKSKVLNYDQYDEYKKKHDDKDRKHRESEDFKRKEQYSDRKRNKDESDRNRDAPADKKSKRDYEAESSTKNIIRHWVRPHLKVRFIDRKYKNGKFYEKKFVVDDVVELDRFVLRSQQGDSLLEDISSSQVETVIPREPRTPVCVLNGKRKGRVGELVEKNKRKETAIIKLPDGAVVELPYDEICEFVGDPEEYY